MATKGKAFKEGMKESKTGKSGSKKHEMKESSKYKASEMKGASFGKKKGK